MKATGSLKRGLARIRRAWLARKFDVAFAQADNLLKEWPDNPHLLVLWADLVQLLDTQEGPTLADAKAAYQRAAELDKESPEALIGLGHFLYAIEDDAKAASDCFAKAITLCRDWLRQTLKGKAEALSEIGRHQEAFECLAEAHWLAQREGKETDGPPRKEIIERSQMHRTAK